MTTEQTKRIWDGWRTVPEESMRKFNNGRFSGTNIDPMFRIKALTEAFGLCGVGWKWTTESIEYKEGSDGNVKCFAKGYLQIKVDGEWSEPIEGTGGNTFISKEKNGYYTDDEAEKKAITDAQSVACKMLGIGADVYTKASVWGTKYDTADPKPTADTKPTATTPSDLLERIEKAKASISKAVTQEEVRDIYASCAKDLKDNQGFRDFVINYGKSLAS